MRLADLPQKLAPALALVVAGLVAPGCHRDAPVPAPAAAGKRLSEVLATTPRQPAFDAPRGTLEAQALGATRGYTKDGKPFAFQLDDLETLQLRVERGRCYRAVVRLARDAVYSDLAERGVRFDVTLPGATAAVPSGGAVGPGAIFDLHCAETTGAATVQVVQMAAAQLAPGVPRPLGSGRAVLQLYSRPARPADRS